MKRTRAAIWTLAAALAASAALGNGGPFVVKYPAGDPAAKGVLARLDPSLKPARESRLRVVKEDLTVTFRPAEFSFGPSKAKPPVAEVTAAYTIANPTQEEIQVDFGFPILRGIYTPPLSMVPKPAVAVTVDGTKVPTTIISNSVIYGIIRQQARQVIERGIASDPDLAALVAAVRRARGVALGATPGQQPVQPAQEDQAAKSTAALRAYLTGKPGWNDRDAALMVAFAGLDFGKPRSFPRDSLRIWEPRMTAEARELLTANLGPLAAIGEQKATQLFALLASRFDKEVAAGYEAIFRAWGGDVRERSIDLDSGKLRPREYTVPKSKDARELHLAAQFSGDPTVYARIDYLDEDAKLSDAEKAACRAVLKSLPVVFTFAPMNLLHYDVSFPAGKTRTVVVQYSQYPYQDTSGKGSYQLAYVLHPATLWDDFGPIHLKVNVPEGVRCVASVPILAPGDRQTAATNQAAAPLLQTSGAVIANAPANARLAAGTPGKRLTYAATLVASADKTGELFIALDMDEWNALWKQPNTPATASR